MSWKLNGKGKGKGEHRQAEVSTVLKALLAGSVVVVDVVVVEERRKEEGLKIEDMGVALVRTRDHTLQLHFE